MNIGTDVYPIQIDQDKKFPYWVYLSFGNGWFKPKIKLTPSETKLLGHDLVAFVTGSKPASEDK